MNNDPQYETRLWMQRQLAAQRHGVKSRLAEYLGVRPDAITRMANTDPEKETREISVREMQGMQRFFGSTPPDMEPMPRMVPIMGVAGAGPDTTVQYATGDENFGEIQSPDDEETVAAVEVRGDSMYGIAQDGWILFHEDREPPGDHHIGELCVCWLADKRVLVKQVWRGSEPGLFDLESASAPSMRNVEVEYLAVITDMKTRRAARRYLRRHPETEVPDLHVPRA